MLAAAIVFEDDEQLLQLVRRAMARSRVLREQLVEAIESADVWATGLSPDTHPVEFARDLFRGDRTRIVIWTPDLPGDI